MDHDNLGREPSGDSKQKLPDGLRLSIRDLLWEGKHGVLAPLWSGKIRLLNLGYFSIFLLAGLLSFIPLMIQFELFDAMGSPIFLVSLACYGCVAPILLLISLFKIGWIYPEWGWQAICARDETLATIPLSFRERHGAIMGPVLRSILIILSPLLSIVLLWWLIALIHITSDTAVIRGGGSDLLMVLSILLSSILTTCLLALALGLSCYMVAQRRVIQLGGGLDDYPGFRVLSPLLITFAFIFGWLFVCCYSPVSSGLAASETSIFIISWSPVVILAVHLVILYPRLVDDNNLAREVLYRPT